MFMNEHSMKKTASIIYCIGDSHVSFFSGLDKMQPLWPSKSEDVLNFFKTFRLGAVLANSLSRYGSAMKGRELLFVLLDRRIPTVEFRAIPPGSKVLFCFGEIDCRAHIIKQAEINDASIEHIAAETADTYSQVLKEIQEIGYEVLVWNVIPPTNPEIQNSDYPHYGDYSQRIVATESFNKQLKKNAEKNNYIFVDIYNDLIDKNRNANLEFYIDQVHLSQKAMPFAICALKKHFPAIFEEVKDDHKNRLLKNYSVKYISNDIASILRVETMFTNLIRKVSSLIQKQPPATRALSQFIDIGFHGDEYLLRLVDQLAGKCKIFIETGSNVGSTLAYVAKNNPQIRCLSCEPDRPAFEQASANVSKYDNIALFNGMSQQFTEHLSKHEQGIFSEQCFFWLDAHGYGFEWPLKKELEFITARFDSAYILIDDFKVPGRDHFEYDKYQEQICSYDYVKDALNPNKVYQLYYPTYQDKTSQYHPLRGWGLLVFGHDDFCITEQLADKMERAM